MIILIQDGMNKTIGILKFSHNYIHGSPNDKPFSSINGILRYTRSNDNHCPDLAFLVKKNFYEATGMEALTMAVGWK